MCDVKNETVRVNVNMSKKIIDKVDAYAFENGINRTAALNVIVSNYFRQDDAMKALQNISELNIG